MYQIRTQKDLRRIANAADPGGDPRRRTSNSALRFFAWAFVLFSLAFLALVIIVIVI
jgi:hypothetical protein